MASAGCRADGILGKLREQKMLRKIVNNCSSQKYVISMIKRTKGSGWTGTSLEVSSPN